MSNFQDFIAAHKKSLVIALVSVIAVTAVIIICVAVFGNSSVYQVTFYDDNNVILKVDSVQHGESAVPPAIPEMTYGSIFKKWDADFSMVEKNLDIRPEFENVKGKSNVFALSGAYCKPGETVKIPFMLCGDVKLSGFDAVIEYDPDMLTLEAVTNTDGDAMYNDAEAGKIKLNFVSANNAEADIDICLLELKLSEDIEQANLIITVNSIYAVDDKDDLYVPEYSIIDSTVYAV